MSILGRALVYSAAAGVSSGATLWYSSDEPMRRKIESVPRSAVRVARLGGTVALIAAEYKIVAPFHSFVDSGFGFGEASAFQAVQAELRLAQDEEEQVGKKLLILLNGSAGVVSKVELDSVRHALAASHQRVCEASERLVELEESANEKDCWTRTHETCANLLLELCR
jgi:hypothetical protein